MPDKKKEDTNIKNQFTSKVQFWVNGIMFGLNSREEALKALETGCWKKTNDQAIEFIGDKAYREITNSSEDV